MNQKRLIFYLMGSAEIKNRTGGPGSIPRPIFDLWDPIPRPIFDFGGAHSHPIFEKMGGPAKHTKNTIRFSPSDFFLHNLSAKTTQKNRTDVLGYVLGCVLGLILGRSF